MEIPKRTGVSKAQFFNRKYDAKLEFSVGLGVQIKKPFREGGMDIFWNCTFQNWSSKGSCYYLLLPDKCYTNIKLQNSRKFVK